MGIMHIAALSLVVLLGLMTPVAIQGQTREEVVLWTSIKDSTNAADFAGYLDKYPDGTFAAVAKRRLESFRNAERAAAGARLRIRVRHIHAWSSCLGHVQLSADGIAFNGEAHTVTLLKTDVIRMGTAGGLFFKSTKGDWTFWMENDRDAPEGGWRKKPKREDLVNLFREQWGFVPDGNELRPPNVATSQ